MKNLKQRITDILEEDSQRVLLQDDLSTWSSSRIQQKSSEIVSLIEKYTWPHQRVGVVFPNSAIQAVCILSVILAGRVPVILSHLDVSQDPEKWLYKTKLSLLIASDDLFQTNQKLGSGLGLNGYGEVTAFHVSPIFQFLKITDYLNSTPHGTALMLYTSGSTGEPKGVFVPESGLLATIDYLTDYFQLSTTTVSPILLPVCHSMALNTQFLPTFLVGGLSYFINARLSMGQIFRHIHQTQGTFVSMIGEVLRACFDEKKRKNLPANVHVRHVQMAGGMILPQHIAMAKDLFPNAKLHKGYGLTEAIRVTMIDSTHPDFASAVVGKPLPFQKIEIRSTDGQQVPMGETGEIFVKGPNVMLGVCGQASAKLDPDGFLSTGDLGYFNDNGELCIVGRADSIFK
ncbi:MAG: class I adenylate-forming enzyme family protein, partial [Pseudobdellovibrionaceae bacterium]